MIFILNILLIIFVIQTSDGNDTQDVEIVMLPLWNTESVIEVPLAFKVFGQLIELRLRKNTKIIAPEFQVWTHNEENVLQELSHLNKPTPCHYLHIDGISSAAISLCQEHGIHGLIFLENSTLEITPMGDFNPLFFDYHFIGERSEAPLKDRVLHIVKRAYAPPITQDYYIRKNLQYEYYNLNISETNQILEKIERRQTNEDLTLELAIFLDETGYNTFAPFFDKDDEKIRDMLLAYINGIQALYHQSSLGKQIDISLVRMDIMHKQPSDLPNFGGERGSLLDSFCNYAKLHNPPDDKHPNHWDLGLYVSGLDFYAVEDGIKNTATMGLATVGGTCIDQYSCVIVELGVTNRFGKPYPSAGFTSVYIAAHEIGHNLGMHHDSIGNSCPRDGYIMSPSRGVQGETIWSECSREVVRALSRNKPCLLDKPTLEEDKSLDHRRFLDLPGKEWNAKKQCEILLLDKDATVATLHQVCQALQCKSPHRSGYYFAGPALDGTNCAPGRECRAGECLPAFQIAPGPGGGAFIREGGWSDWKVGPCSSGCLQRSKGARQRHRSCDNPLPINTEAGCEGWHYDVQLCKDDRLCKKKRKTITEFATIRCIEFSEILSELDGRGRGLQAIHESDRPWIACAIFCRRKDIMSYYTPRIELNDLGLDPYFPDGTWCHEEGGQDYFCRQHHCLPEDFRFAKKFLSDHKDEIELGLGLQNARSNEAKPSDRLIKYFSLGLDGLPLLTSLPANLTNLPPNDDELIDKDYIDLTKGQIR
ncbi:A disintegrin and metalloproteinase with thrombospondin motifs 2-like [Vespa crabro]|uniref:A disintegrin and metalloproteinase with thrombospondin motifs 2-like n=1 Tax=Vespa crabro TaxID=7445 RepID=UPI001EFF7696|nr:A disintegrin and metalloproteinase with thrombospondin motifs 2-like [Vespa crabro]